MFHYGKRVVKCLEKFLETISPFVSWISYTAYEIVKATCGTAVSYVTQTENQLGHTHVGQMCIYNFGKVHCLEAGREVQQIYCGCQELNTVIRTIHTVKKSENKYDILLECYWIYICMTFHRPHRQPNTYTGCIFDPPFSWSILQILHSLCKKGHQLEKSSSLAVVTNTRYALKKLPFIESSQFEKKVRKPR